MALNFYARFKFASELLPLLQAAKDAGEEARVVSVYSAGRGEPIDLDDLGLRKDYGLLRAKNQTTTYNSLAVEVIAHFSFNSSSRMRKAHRRPQNTL